MADRTYFFGLWFRRGRRIGAGERGTIFFHQIKQLSGELPDLIFCHIPDVSGCRIFIIGFYCLFGNRFFYNHSWFCDITVKQDNVVMGEV
jgi:hypothetical protein